MKITYKIEKILILFMLLLPLSITAAEVEVDGVVCDNGNRPLVGYTVRNSANNEEVVSNKRGEFTIKATQGDKIEVLVNNILIDNYTIEDDRNIAIHIAPDPFKMKIETPSYGKIDRARSSAAVDVVTAEELDGNSFFNTSHSLIGKLSSVTTELNDGLPMEDALTLFVRGKSSTTANTPLILVDGFESTLDILNSIEIESVSVLKDAVGQSLYGLRGANGVIIITTKRGVEGKASFKANVEYGVSMPINIPDFVGAADYSRMMNEARSNDGLSPRYTPEQLTLQGSDPYLYPDVNWRDEMLNKMSHITNSSLQISGGSKNIRYYTMVGFSTFSGSLNNTEKNDKYSLQNDRHSLNFRSNVSMDVTKTLTMNVRLGGRIDDSSQPQVGTNSYYNTLLNTPSNRYAIYNPDGSYYGNSTYRSNPMAELVEKGFSDYHSRYFSVNTDLTHKMDYLTKGLSVSGAISFVNDVDISEIYKGSTYAVYEPGIVPERDLWGEPTGNMIDGYIKYGEDKPLDWSSRSTTQNRTQNFRASINYDRAFGKHSVQSSIIGDMSEQVYRNETEPYRYSMVAFSANYGYDNRYFADVVASYNGTNSYAPGSKFGFFPAVGASWITSNEKFFKSEVIDFLKVRASAGITGSDVFPSGYGRFMYVGTYVDDGSHRFGETAGTNSTGLSQGTIPNPNLTWETGYIFNAGVDMRLFDKVSMAFDAFIDKRTDIMQSYDSQISSMFTQGIAFFNYAEVLNRGVDLTLDYKTNFESGVTLGISANAGFAKNKILKYYEFDNPLNSRIGNPIGGIYGYVDDGFYSSDKEVDALPSNFDDVQPGDIKFEDLDCNGHISSYDEKLLGQDMPTYHYGLNIDISYKGFYVAAQLDGSGGNDINLIGNIVYNPLDGGNGNISQFAADNYWTPERGNSAKLPRLSYNGSNHNSQTNTMYLFKGDYLRLRTAEVGYNIPNSWLKKLQLANCRVFLRGHNLFTIDALNGVDPEVISGYPLLRTFAVGLNVGF